MLTREQILNLTDKAMKEIEIPEWGGSVFIRGTTIDDLDYFEAIEKDSENFQKMIIRFVCDESGAPIFSEEDLPLLRKKSIQAMKRILDNILEFNSLGEAEKN